MHAAVLLGVATHGDACFDDEAAILDSELGEKGRVHADFGASRQAGHLWRTCFRCRKGVKLETGSRPTDPTLYDLCEGERRVGGLVERSAHRCLSGVRTEHPRRIALGQGNDFHTNILPAIRHAAPPMPTVAA